MSVAELSRGSQTMIVGPVDVVSCAECGRSLMTGERAERREPHGQRPEVVCELCRHGRPDRDEAPIPTGEPPRPLRPRPAVR